MSHGAESFFFGVALPAAALWVHALLAVLFVLIALAG